MSKTRHLEIETRVGLILSIKNGRIASGVIVEQIDGGDNKNFKSVKELVYSRKQALMNVHCVQS